MADVLSPLVLHKQFSPMKRVRTVFSSREHPFSKLTNLRAIGALQALSKNEHGSSSRNMISVTASVRDFACSAVKVESSLKRARLSAATEVLQQVQTYILANPPTVLTPPPSPPIIPDRPVSPRERKQMEIDNDHLNTFLDLRFLSTETNRTVGLLSIDLEQYEHDDKVTLEVGMAFVEGYAATDRRAIKCVHLINRDRLDVANGDHVADHRLDFNHGKSQFVAEEELAGDMRRIILEWTKDYDVVFLVGHTIQSDLSWLAAPEMDEILADMKICDIGRVYRALQGCDQYFDMTGMSKMLPRLGIEVKHLHNGGNDSVYNLAVVAQLWSLESVMSRSWALLQS